jgi:hypothetical protein
VEGGDYDSKDADRRKVFELGPGRLEVLHPNEMRYESPDQIRLGVSRGRRVHEQFGEPLDDPEK